MGVSYAPILWNRQKKRYDLFLLIGIVVYLIVFVTVSLGTNPEITQETALIRGFGSLAFIMLHLILCIGPLARINEKFLPLLYNRRHFGVTMFLMASVHGIFSILQFHSLGDTNPLVSLFLSNTEYTSLTNFPFQTLGFYALIILFLMAATSHDFWLHNLTPRIWKTLHMFVYLVYTLLFFHVMLGIVQTDGALGVGVLTGLGAAIVITVHIVAALKEGRVDNDQGSDEYYEVGTIDEIANNRAKIVVINNERVAVFRYDGKLSAVSNVCCHQNGPLGEGKIIDGLITCPWHGYQYQPHDGCAPAPFTERVETYELKLEDRKIYIKTAANEPGTYVEPVVIPE